MTDIAFLLGKTVICWSHLMIIPGIFSGCIFVFALCPFTKVRKQAVILWLPLTVVLSFFLSRLFYFYCRTTQFISVGDALSKVFDSRHCAAGLVFGALLATLVVRLSGLETNTGRLLDTVFPGVMITLALIRASCFFTGSCHSTIAVRSALWQRFPFAVKMTDAAGNAGFVFAPFFISFILLLSTVFIITFCVRKKIKQPGNIFLLYFLVLALSEMVLESTRSDSLRLHFLFLQFLNRYVSFISFPMFVFGLSLLAIFFSNYKKSAMYIKRNKRLLLFSVFTLGFLCFGICEFFVQRYTSSETLFHWLQAFFAWLMGVGLILVIRQKTLQLRRQKKRAYRRCGF